MLSLFAVVLFQEVSSQIQGPCTTSSQYTFKEPLSEYQLAHFEQNSSIYIFGGRTSDTDHHHDYSRLIWKWDLTKDGFFNKTNITTPTKQWLSWSNNVVVIDQYAYFVGVMNGNWTNNILYRFDVKTQTFQSNFTRMKVGAVFGCVTTNTTHIFMVGGNKKIEDRIYLNMTQIYDIHNDKWSLWPLNIESLNQHGISNSMCIMLNNTMYVFGGKTKLTNATVYNGIWKVEWPNNTWKLLGNLSQPLAGAALVNQCDKNIILSGGIWNAQAWVNDHIDIFDNDEESIIDRDKYKIEPSAAYMSAVIVDDEMYIIGGDNDGDPQRVVQICKLENVCSGSTTTNHNGMINIVFAIGGFLIALVLTYEICKRHMRRKDSDDLDDAGMLMIAK